MAIKKNIPLAAMERIMKKVGAERVSEESKEALRDTLENQAEEIATASLKFAVHAGRKTIKAEDIILATK
ncbi:histone family protein [Nanoarchaeota archaeon]